MTRYRFGKHAVAFVALTVVAVAAALAGEAGRKSRFTADQYIAHVRYLASDELGGRGPGSPGIDLAADYISEKFKAAGLKPMGDDGTWFQHFEVDRGRRLMEDKAKLEIADLGRALELKKDWIPFPFSASDEAEGPLAFAGYGISAEEYEFDDYKDFNAEGKILLVFRYEPKSADAEAAFGGKTASNHALFTRKATVAKKAGAKGLLVVNPPIREGGDDKLYAFDASAARGGGNALPMAHITAEVADAILKKAGAPTLAELQKQLDAERKPLSRDLGLTVHLTPGLEAHKVKVKNVIGMLTGAGNTEETVIVGGHYDHLGTVPRGFGGSGSEPVIHNGADDNASGTSGVLELVRAMSEGPRPRRNVLFMTFTCEEMGLLGSKHFVKNPTIDLGNVVAMFNLDMIGRLGDKQMTIYGTKTAKEFNEIVDAAAEEMGIGLRKPRGVPGNSDHDPFYKAHIPVLFPFTDLHKQYHKPEDDWELIDGEGAARVLDFSVSILDRLANMTDGPTREEDTSPPEPRDQQKRPGEEERAAAKDGNNTPTDAPRPTMPRVRLGVMPDYAGDDKPGLLVESVVEGGAAKEAGMKDGDRIIEMGGQAVNDIYGYMEGLKSAKPGDTMEIVVERGGAKVKLSVKFKAAPEKNGE